MYLRLLGEVAVRGADDAWHGAGPAKRAGVLAALALSAGTSVTQEQLIARVWGNDAPAAVRSAVYSHITRLRRLLAPWPGEILRAPGGYRLDVDDDAIDLLVMRGLVARGTALSGCGEYREAARVLREAELLWHGPPLSDVDSGWAERVRFGLHRERVSLAESRFDAELACGAHTEILDELRGVAQAYPESEKLTRQLMLALYRCGRQAEALECYRHTVRRLRDDSGLEPGHELRELYRQILHHDTELRPQPPAAAPEETGPRQLPPLAGGFVVRAGADTALGALITVGAEGGATPIGVVTGMAGVGKTATVLHWAHRNAATFPGGQLFADLGGFSGAEEPCPATAILADFLLALGVRGSDIPTEKSARVAAFRSHTARRRLLVVLDNSASAEQVRSLIPAGPGSLVLVTSRNNLSGLVAVDGARRIGLEPMDDGTAELVLIRQLGEPRVRAEPEAAAELAQACGGLPLALRIAAAGLIDHPEHSIGELVRDLSGGDRLTALSVPGDTTAGVRAAFGHSLRGLDAFTRDGFAALGLVPGPTVSAAALAAMLGASAEATDAALRELATAHLAHSAEPGYFGQHDLLKECARGQVDEAVREQRTRRLFDWYVHAARNASETISATSTQLPVPDEAVPPRLPRFADPAEATAWFAAETDNLTAVVHAAADRHHPAAWLLPEAMRLHLARNLDYPRWLAAARTGLAAARHSGDPQATAAMHYQVALHAKITGDGDTAADQLALALTAAESAGDRLQAATVHASLADMHLRHGRLAAAIEHSHRVLALEPLPERQMMIALNVLGLASREQGDLDQARRALERNVELLSGGVDYKLAPTMESLALTYLDMGDFERALRTAEEVVERAKATGPIDRAASLRALALIHYSMGDAARARRLAGAALALVADPAMKLFRAPVLVTMARVEPDDPDRALAYAREALDLAGDLVLPWTHTEARLAMAEVWLRRGELGSAAEAVLAAREGAERHGYVLLRAQALTTQADVHVANGEPAEAAQQLRQACELHRQAGHRHHLSQVERKLAAPPFLA